MKRYLPQTRRVRWIVTLVAMACLAAITVPVLAFQTSQAGDPPLGTGRVALLEALAAPSPDVIPGDIARWATSDNNVDLSRTRKVTSFGGMDLYVGPSSEGDGKVCAFAARRAPEGIYSSGACAPPEAARTGLLAVELQTAAGGVETSRVRFGVVPDDVVVVRGLSRQSVVSGNVYALQLPNGNSLSTLRFEKADGSSVPIKVAGN